MMINLYVAIIFIWKLRSNVDPSKDCIASLKSHPKGKDNSVHLNKTAMRWFSTHICKLVYVFLILREWCTYRSKDS